MTRSLGLPASSLFTIAVRSDPSSSGLLMTALVGMLVPLPFCQSAKNKYLWNGPNGVYKMEHMEWGTYYTRWSIRNGMQYTGWNEYVTIAYYTS